MSSHGYEDSLYERDKKDANGNVFFVFLFILAAIGILGFAMAFSSCQTVKHVRLEQVDTTDYNLQGWVNHGLIRE